MATWRVTRSAMRRYRREAEEARERLAEAKEAMKSAAAELCSKWIGDASIAFAEEQNVLDSWYSMALSVGAELCGAVEAALNLYEETEAELASKVNG